VKNFNNNMCRYEHVRVCLVPYSDRKHKTSASGEFETIQLS